MCYCCLSPRIRVPFWANNQLLIRFYADVHAFTYHDPLNASNFRVTFPSTPIVVDQPASFQIRVLSGGPSSTNRQPLTFGGGLVPNLRVTIFKTLPVDTAPRLVQPSSIVVSGFVVFGFKFRILITRAICLCLMTKPFFSSWLC
jgi:hypothetical protein